MNPVTYPSPKTHLELRHIGKHFHTRQGKLHVLDDVNLQVSRGEFLCLLGPSGSGKSTLFNIIAGLEPPDTGEVLIEGKPVTEPGPDRVVVFQDGALFPWLTVQGNVEFGLTMAGIPAAERKERVKEALAMVRLSRFAGACIHELSGGMRQRVAIARAIVMRPKVLLMDEPFAALDAQTRNVMHEELQRIWLQTGKTVIFVTHNVAEAVRLGDRVAVLSFRPGRIKREVKIHRPRPRLADDPHLLEIRTFLVRDLKHDVHAAVEEELDDA
ncbi:MAG TPA: ABC transporter ATP-binding protein [Symbiobacteriaceae bacterium]|nr:ABC transporter ATP-binding protein [Symbiobacteriaceae bacterium]